MVKFLSIEYQNHTTTMNKTSYPNIAFIDGEMERNMTTVHLSIDLTMDRDEKAGNFKDDEYDPYENRQVKHPTSNSDTMIHLLKGVIGTGIFAMPIAFSRSGYVVGFVSTIVVGIIYTHCIHMLLRSHYELCKRKKVPSLKYSAVLEAAFQQGPNWSRAVAPYINDITNGFMVVNQLGSCCVFLVFVADNTKAIADTLLDKNIDVRLIMLIFLVPLILINWIRNLKDLTPFTTLANVITLLSFAIICYYMFREPITVDDKQAFGSPYEFPFFFGTVVFALVGIGFIMPLENEMKTPKSFGGNFGVLNKSMAITIFLYAGMGLFGYLKYGDKTAGSITLNLPKDEVAAQLAKGMLAISIFITHGLNCYVAIDITWTEYVKKRLTKTSPKLFWEYVVRTVLVLITFLLAVAIPNLELFISLIGALCLSVLGLVFPAMVECCTFYKETTGLSKVIMITRNAVIILIGLAGLTVGTYTSLSAIICKFFI